MGKYGRQAGALARRWETPLSDAAVALVVIVGLGAAASGASSQAAGHPAPAGMDRTNATGQQHLAVPAKPLTVESVTPGSSSHWANGAHPVTVTFNSALSPSTRVPAISPNIAGSWQISGKTATFTPKTGFTQRTSVTVTIPAGMTGRQLPSVNAKPTLRKTVVSRFSTGWYSTARLQQVLATLGYLPMTFHRADSPGAVPGSDASAQLSAAYDAPKGSFSWNGKYPSQLEGQWRGGEDNMLDKGAVRAFESDHGLTMDGVAGPQVWSSLLSAVAKGQKNPHGYTYALTTQGASHENLQVYHNGREILYTAANTGVAGAPTADGTYPVYDRLTFQMMKGTNPDGTKYNDPVSWISYFDGGDAVHAFSRAGYGWYQSDGCVELPPSTAKWLWPYMTYGTLVTVQGPVA